MNNYLRLKEKLLLQGRKKPLLTKENSTQKAGGEELEAVSGSISIYIIS
jgi:hypothetical protein